MLVPYLVAGAVLFVLGIFAVISRRNAIAVLMGVELMLNAANLNFLAFWRYLAPGSMEAQVFVLVGITVAAAEAAVGLAVILNIYRDFGTIAVERINELKG
ncbi:MAG: NADH-quinone oxidoreductase subunit NuoK [Chthonomonadales bacterium]